MAIGVIWAAGGLPYVVYAGKNMKEAE